MDLQYINYSIEELADDDRFIAWVLRNEEGRQWDAFIRDNPGFGEKAEKARKLVMLLHEHGEAPDEKDVAEIWENIDLFNRSQTQKSHIARLRRPVYWAAAVLLVFSLGFLGYKYFAADEVSYQFASDEAGVQNNDARIILADGEQIALKKNNSRISLIKDNKLIINNDSIIDLSRLAKIRDKKSPMNEIVIPFGKRSVLYLADGTKVWLNAGTRFAFPSLFSRDKREVFLEGEAYFEVARNVSQPFIVHAGQLNIKVLGTRFNVSAYASDANIETTLLEGSVAVSERRLPGLVRSEVVLKPDQKASFNRREKKVTVSNVPDADMYISWTKGWLQFSHENLQMVFEKLKRYYNVDIVTSKNFKDVRSISGKLEITGSLDEVMKALADVAKIHYRIQGKTIYIEQN